MQGSVTRNPGSFTKAENRSFRYFLGSGGWKA